MMGLAFHKMIDRVFSQQTRLTQLVAELQEALQAKMSFLAIQEELRIAENVQRSFLPGREPGNSACGKFERPCRPPRK